MTYQSAFLNIELVKAQKAPKEISFTLELRLKDLVHGLLRLLFQAPSLKRSIAPGQTKQLVDRNLGRYQF